MPDRHRHRSARRAAGLPRPGRSRHAGPLRRRRRQLQRDAAAIRCRTRHVAAAVADQRAFVAAQRRLLHPHAQRPQRRLHRSHPASLGAVPDQRRRSTWCAATTSPRRSASRSAARSSSLISPTRRSIPARSRSASPRTSAAPKPDRPRSPTSRPSSRTTKPQAVWSSGDVKVSADPLHPHRGPRVLSRRHAGWQRGDRRRRRQRHLRAAAPVVDLDAGRDSGEGRRRHRAFGHPSGDGP